MTEIAKAAAKWWRNVLEQKLRGNAALQSPASEGVDALRDVLFETTTLPSKQIDAFEAALTDEIHRMMDAVREHYYPVVTLSVDYDPCQALHAAAVSAGLYVPFGYWPFKTAMAIHDGRVDVRLGMHAEVETIYIERLPVM